MSGWAASAMGSSSKSLPLLAVVLALVVGGGGVAWLVLRQDVAFDSLAPGARAPAGAVDPIESEAPPESRELVAIGPVEEPSGAEPREATTVVHPLELELSLIQRGNFDLQEGLPAVGTGATARLRGHLFGPDGRGLEGSVTFVAGTNEGRVLRCDATGEYGAADLYAGLGVVRCQTNHGYVAEREVRLRPRTEEVLTVGFGHPASVYGAVVDGENMPIEGADVRLDGLETRTDERGEFHFPSVASGSALAIVSKPGFATYREVVPIPRGRVVEAGRLRFRLEPGASLEITVLEIVGAREQAEVYLIPTGGQPVNREAGQRTFPWYRVNPVRIHPGGTALVEDLPEGRVALMLFHSGAVANPRQSAVKLSRGSKRQVVLHLEPAQQLRGRVLREGNPVSGAWATLEAPDRTGATIAALAAGPEILQSMVLPHVAAGVQRVRTDDSGRFFFTVFPEFTSRYYLSASTTDGTWSGNRVVAADAGDVELPLERTRTEGRLHVAMAGRYQGLPVRVRVDGAPRDPIDLAAEDQLWIDHLVPGTWRVDASWDDVAVLRGQIVEVVRDAELDLVLPAGALHGQTDEERRRAGY